MFGENCDKPYITVNGKFLTVVKFYVFKLYANNNF